MPTNFGPLLIGDPRGAKLEDLTILLGKYYLSRNEQAFLAVTDGIDRVPLLPLHQNREKLMEWAEYRQAPYNQIGQIVDPMLFLKTVLKGLLEHTHFTYFLLMIDPILEGGQDRFAMVPVDADIIKAYEESHKAN